MKKTVKKLPKNQNKRQRFNSKKIIVSLIIVLIALFSGAGIDIAIRPSESGEISISTNFSLHLSDKQQPAVIENEAGEDVEISDIVTVEEVDGDQLAEECGEDEECGKGWYVDTSSPDAFITATTNQCIDTDGHYGSQCWDLGNLFWQNYAGRNLSTCGTGAAKGIINCVEQNAGDEFEFTTDINKIQKGAWLIFTNGAYGHIGMSRGTPNNGYVTLYGTNQGGANCSGGGSTANTINISLKHFGGAFIPKAYIKEEPQIDPVIPISNCVKWHVLKGDTMGKIMLECEGTVVYGEPMNAYAKTWYSLVYKPNQSVYDGWASPGGVGLYAGDDIEHRINGE